MKPTQNQQKEALTVHDLYWKSYLNGDVETLASLLDEQYTQIGSVEEEVFFDKKDAVQFVVDTIDQVAGKVEMRHRVTKLEPLKESILISEQCDLFVWSDDEWSFYSRFRASSLLQEKENGWKMVHQHSSLPDSKAQEGENIAIDKITTENLQLRDAIKRRTIELEIKNRELQVEAALERVRARTMAMRHSDELKDAAALLFQQVKALGVPIFSCGYNIWEKNEMEFTAWMSNSDGTGIDPAFRLPLAEDANFIRFNESRQEGEEFYVLEMRGERMQEHYRFLIKNIPVFQETFENIKKSGGVLPETQIHHIVNFSHGNLQFITFETCPEAHEVFKRFGKVFEQTFTRFLDLQKAEAQAREARIEAALERVRAQSMAMHKSEELVQVVRLLNKEIADLGIAVGNSQIVVDIVKHEEGFNIWLAVEGQNYLEKFHVPYVGQLAKNIVITKLLKAKTDKVDFYIEKYAKKEKDQHFRLAFKYTDYKRLPEESKKRVYSFPGMIRANVLSKNSVLMFVRWDLNDFTKEEEEIFKRFGKVFDQAYTRFLDLQKAEAQAREARIEAALERVRARTMAMQHSNELLEVASVVFQQVKALGVPQWDCGVNIWDKGDTEFTYYPGTHEGKILPSPCKIPLMEHPVFRRFHESRMRGEDLFIYEKQGEEQTEHYQYMLTVPVLGDLLHGMEAAGFQFPKYQIDHLANFAYGNLIFITYEHFPEMHEVFKRLAKVFEQTYTRFLDLQKAEAQAREAQIEAALEKVRSRTMAMQHSNELSDTASLLFQQIKSLGVPPWSCGFNIWERGETEFTSYMGSPDGIILQGLKIPLFEEATFIHFHETRERGDALFVEVLEGQGLEDHYSYLLSLPEIKKAFEKREEAGVHRPTFQINHLANFSHGNLMFITYEPCPEAHDLFIRFAKVFEQTYTRFLDLQKAEAQTRETQIQLALERVRARTMAMQSSEELAEVSYLLNKQVVDLGIPTWGCAFNIYGEHDSTEWFSNLEGSFPTYKTPRENIFLKYYEAGQRGESLLIEEFGGERIKELYKYLATLNNAGDESINDQIANSPDYQINHMAYFKYGYLLFVTLVPAPEAHDVFKRFSKEFEQTYTRFLDLQKAEAQAREAQVEVAMERIRARALSMQSSGELSGVAKVLRDQMGMLGQEDLEASVVHLYSTGSPTFDSWYAYRAGDEIIEGIATFRLENSALAKEFLKLYEDEVTEYTIEVKGEKLREWLAEIQRNAPKIAAYWGDLPPEKQFYHFSDFSGGALLMVSHQHPTVETRMLQKRCASVFELAYKRFLDLEAKERQEKELLEEKQRLEIALSELKATQSQLIQSEKMASLGELTAGIAHEIQNPLNFVNNFSEVSAELIDEIQDLRRKTQDGKPVGEEDEILEDIKQNLEKITLHGKRADAIVKGMLEHSKRGSGQKEPTDINALADEFLRLTYQSFLAKDANFHFELNTNFDPDLPRASVIPQDIGKVLLNLYSNAFYTLNEKAKKDPNFKPLVELTTRNLGDKIEIGVKDNGQGIPNSIKEKIFQPFFTTKPTGSGTGLGLSLSYDIVKAHGGTLKVESEEWNGTEFIATLPTV